MDKQKIATPRTPVRIWLTRISLVVLFYLFATGFTSPWLMGDTVDYADSILAYDQGRYLQFWEFGHLFWRPLCWVLFRILSPLTSLIFGAEDRIKVTFTLIAINWVAGLACLLLLHALISRVCNRPWIVNLATIGLLFSSAFLNYGQTGSAYVPGLALVLLGALLLVQHTEQTAKGSSRPFMAGLALAGAVCLWVPFVLLLPAALTLPLFLNGWDRTKLLPLLQASVMVVLFTAVSYLTVIALLRINSLAGLQDWVTSASHGMNRMRGVPRMVFGFANSLIDLGGEGALFKRYLKHDAFNPVSLIDLVRFSLWKLAFAYIFLFCVLINLLRSDRGRRILGLLIVDLVPTIFFALFIFEAGDMSRYIAVLPLLFLAVAYSLCSEKSLSWTRYIIIVFIVTAAITNVRAMAASTLNQREQRVESRIRDLLPLLKPESRVVTSHLQDEINNFTRDFLFNPINRSGDLRYYAVISVNTAQVEHWQGDFASMALSVWERGGDLWASKRLLTSRPRAEWSWVEGDDSRVSWTDLYTLFSQLQMGQAVGGEDGFVLLLPSEKNKEILHKIVLASKSPGDKTE